MGHTLKWFLIIGLAFSLSACTGDNPPDSDMFTYYLDSDRDGYGDPGNAIEVEYAEPPVGYVDNDDDCDDANAVVSPEAEEVCDQVDNNCNGESDEGVTTTYYADDDGDRYGNSSDTTQACYVPDGYVENDTDCDDTNAATNPGAREICDQIDNNCNGLINEGGLCNEHTYYRDADADGYGDPDDSIEVTNPSPPNGYVGNNSDCNDANATINPEAEEVCDQTDNNCNSAVDEGGACGQYTYYKDTDGDGYGDPDDATTSSDSTPPDGYVANNTDCDDENAEIKPSATEACDEVDNNCNGQVDEGVTTTYYADGDGDGSGNAGAATQACSAPTGYVEDNTDCDDINAAVHPGAQEVEDGIDNDCDGEIDEDIQAIPLPPENVSASDIESGLTYIAVTWDASDGATYYKIYRAIWEEDAEYEPVAGNITGTSYDFVQDWQTDVYDIIGPNPAIAPDADVTARADFMEALEVYREDARPVLFNFKAPAYFKIEACNDLGCSDMSDFDAGQAEYVHTATESEVAQLLIPAWGYPNLKSLTDSPPGAQGIGWCGIDICGSVEGMVMGRLDRNGLPQIDVYYENYTDGWDLHPNARFWADGYIGGAQRLIPSSKGVVKVSGEFDIRAGAIDAHMFVYSYIGGTTGNENDGYVSITYKGETHQYTLPVQPVAGQDYADPPAPVVPARNDADYTIDRRDTDYPVPFSEQPNTECKNWSDEKIVHCNRVP
jgi:hypothetical protein